jgi:hypothetical protein
MNRRKTFLVAALLALLVLVAGWSLQTMLQAQASAAEAKKGLADCRRLAAHIAILSQLPATASDRERQGTELSATLEQAAQAAGIPTDRLIRISPEPAQRVGDSVYKEKPTRVIVKNVGLRPLVTMIHRVMQSEGGWTLSSLRVTAPSRDATENLWTAELVFTYLVYEPLPIRS